MATLFHSNAAATGSLQGRSLFALVREWWRPLLTALGLCMVVLMLRPQNTFDRQLSDKLLVSQKHAPDPDILLIEIDSADVRRYGGPPFSRDGMAKVMNRLADGRAERVLLDMYLGEPLIPEPDDRLEAALARLGPKRLGLVTAPTPYDLPLARFARHGTIIDARLTPDVDGWHRRIGTAGQVWGNSPVQWLATGRKDNTPVNLDLRIASRKFERRSAHELITSTDDLSGKLVIIGVSARIAATRAFMPLTSIADRSAVIAVGVQSRMQDHQVMRNEGMMANTAVQVLAILMGFLAAMGATSGRRMVFTTLAIAVVLMGLCIMIAGRFAVEIYPVSVLGGLFVMANVTLVQRLKVIPMMASFLKGDVSPEEAWAWRSCENVNHAVVLFAADGRIKRSNAAADGLIEDLGDRLAPLCLPRLGERAEDFAYDQIEGAARYYQVDWPYGHVPIAILRDTSEAEAAQRSLKAQLLTDELTGGSNRRGFETALNRASASGLPYTVFFLDMNGFKAVNDTYGHDAGDELLIVVMKRLSGLVRPNDTVARMGGDEFAVVMAGQAELSAARAQASRFADAIRTPIRLDSIDSVVKVGTAVGYSVSRDPEESTAAVLRRADQAMYRDKLQSKLALANAA